MKIIILGSGKSYHATRWANKLSENGHEIMFISQHEIVRPLEHGVIRYVLPIQRKYGYVLNILFLRKKIAQFCPDLVHAHYSTGYGLLARLSLFKPLVISIYGADVYDFPKTFIKRWFLSWILRGATHVTSTSNNMRIRFNQNFPELPDPKVIPFGVDINLFKPQAQIAITKSTKTHFIVGVVKKLEEKYGIDVLLYAVKLFMERNPVALDLRIVGVGSKLQELTELACNLGLSQNVKFLGEVENKLVPRELRKLDVVVIPSRHESESFGVAAVEASACGIPVIVTDVGGLPEVITDSINGLVVKKENPMLICVALERIFNDNILAKNFGINGRKKVLKFYNWDDNVNEMIDLYEQTIGIY